MNANLEMNPAWASSDNLEHWHAINWCECHKNVSRLQARIVKATQEGRWNKVKTLQWLLTRSQSAKAIAVKRVTENQGKRTAGVDGETWETPEAKLNGLNSLKRRGYKPLPLRRVEIPKKNGKKRKLGIPTMKDRAMQALYLLALDPVAETTADYNSYGFRPSRSTADAREQGYISLAKKVSPEWVLEGDIKGCFDNISHDWLLNNIPMDRKILEGWLKAGCIFNGEFITTEAGTPQGGIISPTLANMALDGLERKLNQRFRNRRYWDKEAQTTRVETKQVNFIRYADDFIITGISKELLENEVKPLVVDFLKDRGLELAPEKTRITHINDGFDFLGWNIRKYSDQKLLTKPSDGNVKGFLDNVRGVFDDNKTATPHWIISKLNPIISGWAQYHKGAVAKEIFSYVDHQIWLKTMQWAIRRHPHKGKKWIKDKYFKRIGTRDWCFFGEFDGGNTVLLNHAASVEIVRHTKVKADANPYDPKYEEYFEKRLEIKMKKGLVGKRKIRNLWVSQSGKCPVCQTLIDDVKNVNIHHIVGKAKGGTDLNSNLILLHPNCHRKVHSRGLTVSKPGR